MPKLLARITNKLPTATDLGLADSATKTVGTSPGTVADGGTLSSHTSNTANPHSTTAAQVGADVAGTASSAIAYHAASTNHPVATTSTKGMLSATDKTKLDSLGSAATQDSTSFDAAGAATNVIATHESTTNHPAATTSAKGMLSSADKSKLDGIAAGATVNATDASLRDRSLNTGFQAISTVTGLQTALDGKQSTFGSTGANLIFAGPSTGNASTPAFRALAAADIPTLSYMDLTSNQTIGGNKSFTGKLFLTPTTTQTLTATSTIQPNAGAVKINAGTAITLISRPSIATIGAVDGQEIVVMNVGMMSITFQDNNILSGSGVKTGGSNITLKSGQYLMFIYSSDLGLWVSDR